MERTAIAPSPHVARAAEYRAFLSAHIGALVWIEFRTSRGTGNMIGRVQSVGTETVIMTGLSPPHAERCVALEQLTNAEERAPHASPRRSPARA